MLLGFNKRFWTVVTCLVIAGIIFVVYPSYARQQDYTPALQQDSVSIGKVVNPGILPDSPFYFIKGCSRACRFFFAFKSQKKAELALRFADEDALAIKKLCDRAEYISTGKQCGRFQEQFQRAIKLVEQARQEGKDIQWLMDKLKEDHLGQQRVLASVLEDVPEWAGEGVLITIGESSSSLENTIEKIQGKQELSRFQQELNLQFSNVADEIRIKIQERLGIDSHNPGEIMDTVATQALVNHTPTITSLMANDDQLTLADKCHIECKAEDTDGDSLSYRWSASGGDISGSGSSVIWDAPEEEGSYEVRVTVSDGQGGEDKRSLTISVEPPDPLVIEELVVTPETPKYFVKQLAGYVILRGKSCDIECVTSGGYRPSYEWSASKGNISGNDSLVVWTAPSCKCDVTITVTVADRIGNMVTEKLFFHVSTCSLCFN